MARPKSPLRIAPDSEGSVYPFIRYAHILASTLREIVEEKFLKEVSPYPLTISQFQLIKLIAVKGEHLVGEIAEFLGVSPAAATKNVDKLERLGLVKRGTSEEDRRATVLSLTPDGRGLVEQYETLKATRLAPVLAEFTDDELEQAASVLERFSLSLIGREDSGEGLCFRCAAYWEEHCPVGHVRGSCPYDRIRPTLSPEPSGLGGS